MQQKNWIEQLFCLHDNTTTTGIGLYQKGDREILRFYPCLKIVCKKCGRERIIKWCDHLKNDIEYWRNL